MRVIIEAESADEFEMKKARLVKKLSPPKAIAPRKPVLQAQEDIVNHWNEEFRQMLEQIKEEISDELG